MLYLWIAGGGALGAVARYAVGGWVHAWAGAAYPWGTLAVNVVGAALLGFLYRLFGAVPVTPELRGFIAVGFLGAFTTFSTFSYEAALLVQDREWGAAALYSLGSVVLGLGAVFVGFWAAASILHAGATR